MTSKATTTTTHVSSLTDLGKALFGEKYVDGTLLCAVDGCMAQNHARSRCQKHYDEFRRAR